MEVCAKCGGEMKGGANFCKACGSGMHDEKKARVIATESRGPRTVIVVVAALALIVAGWLIYGTTSRARPMDGPMMGGKANREGNTHVQYKALRAENGDVRVPIGALQAGAADYYVYSAGGKDIKFFVLRAADGTVRAALDACNACYHARKGYRHEGESMVCNNCGMTFKSSDIGRYSGGCNPVPLQNSQDGTTLTVKAADLEAGARYF